MTCEKWDDNLRIFFAQVRLFLVMINRTALELIRKATDHMETQREIRKDHST